MMLLWVKDCVRHHNLCCKYSVSHHERRYTAYEMLQIHCSCSSYSHLALQNGHWEQKANYFIILEGLNAAVLTSAGILSC